MDTILRYLVTSSFHFHNLIVWHPHCSTSFLSAQKVVFEYLPTLIPYAFLFSKSTSHTPSQDFTALTIQGHLHKSWSPSLRNVLNYSISLSSYRSHILLSTLYPHTCTLHDPFDVRDHVAHSVHKTIGKVICVIWSSRFLKVYGIIFKVNNNKQFHSSLFPWRHQESRFYVTAPFQRPSITVHKLLLYVGSNHVPFCYHSLLFHSLPTSLKQIPFHYWHKQEADTVKTQRT